MSEKELRKTNIHVKDYTRQKNGRAEHVRDHSRLLYSPFLSGQAKPNPKLHPYAQAFVNEYPDSHMAYDVRKGFVPGGGFAEALNDGDLATAFSRADSENTVRMYKLFKNKLTDRMLIEREGEWLKEKNELAEKLIRGGE